MNRYPEAEESAAKMVRDINETFQALANAKTVITCTVDHRGAPCPWEVERPEKEAGKSTVLRWLSKRPASFFRRPVVGERLRQFYEDYLRRYETCPYCGEHLYLGLFHRRNVIAGLVTGLVVMVATFALQTVLEVSK